MLPPELRNKWSFMAEELHQSRCRENGRSVSIGFYCGLLDGQNSADYIPLADKKTGIPQEPYNARFLATDKILDTAFRITVKSDGSTGKYSVKDTNSPLRIRICGSVPVFPPFLLVRQCLYFGFSPYLLKR